MAQELSQEQVQVQTQMQSLTPQQILTVRLLELPVSDLESRVQNEMLENAALEELPSGEDVPEEVHDENPDFDEERHETIEEQYAADQRADYATEDDIPEYLLRPQNYGGGSSSFQIGQSESLYDQLLEQMGQYHLTSKQRQITEYLIGSLDGDGLLRKNLTTICDELAIYHYIEATEEEIEACLKVIQTFEPTGIGARSLQECLLLQLADRPFQSNYEQVEKDILTRSFDDFAHKRKKKLSESYHLSEEDIEQIYAELSRLNPRPGSGMGDAIGQGAASVVPDFIVRQDEDGSLLIRLNHGDVPQLRVSPSYKELIEEYSKDRKSLNRKQKEEYVYSRKKVDAAQTFINALQQRQDTMMKTMRMIVSMQKPFFEEGDETLIRPMVQKDVAQRVGVDISTISRVANSKYVETDFGIFPLKIFFNNSFVTKDGEELSKMKIKATIKELIEGEDKNNPLSDDALGRLLKEKGFPVARRTIAKYREQLGIPVARLRK